MELNEIYQMFDEDKRLNTSKARSIEFLTTVRFIERYLQKDMKIIDIGAGTGAYSLYYAKQGYDVTAVEPVERNLASLKSKISDDMKIKAILGNALDLSEFDNDSFDLVLCFGPLYHLISDEEKQKCIEETRRICKPKGKILYAYISNDMVFVTESALYNADFLGSDQYNHETLKVKDIPFVFMTVDKMKDLMANSGMKEIAHFAADGLGELLYDKINAFTESQFCKWLDFHFYTCEKEELLGYSNHIVYIAEKI